MKHNNIYKKIIIAIITLTTVVSNVAVYIPVAQAAINKEINYQGKLTNASNVAVADGIYNMEFKLYTQLTGGVAIWTETLTTTNKVQVTNGLFSVMLGSTTSLTGIDFNQTLYLGVNIESDGEMSPRKIIGTVPSALVSENSNTLQGLNSSEFLRTDIQNATSSSNTFLNILQTGAGKVAEFFGSASQSVLSLLSNGNVGIGTSTPYASLAVVGQIVGSYFTGTTTATSTFGGNLAINGTGTTTSTGGFDLSAGCFAVSGNCLKESQWTTTGSDIYYNTGNVGLGTAFPTKRLTLNGTDQYISFNDADVERWAIGNGSASDIFTIYNSIISNYALTIDPTNNNIGFFGTTTPGTKLSIGNTGVNTINISATATSTFGSGLNIRTGCFAIGNSCLSLSNLGGTLSVAKGGTGQTSFGQGWLGINDSGAFISSTSPTVNYITATSTTATSTFAGDVVIGGVVNSGAKLNIVSGGQSLTFGQEAVNGTSVLFQRGTNFAEYRNQVGSIDMRMGVNGSEGYSGTFSAHPFALYTSNIDRLTILPGGNIGIGTSTPYSPLSVWGGTTGNIFEAVTSASSSALSISATGFGTTTVSGLNISGSATTTSNVGINLSAGCFAVNNTCLTNSTYGDASVNSYISASTTIPKTYTANTFTGLQTFNGGISLSSALSVANGGTGQTSFGQGWLGINDSGAFISSTSPTVNYITATSTTATSTFAGDVVIGGVVNSGAKLNIVSGGQSLTFGQEAVNGTSVLFQRGTNFAEYRNQVGSIDMRMGVNGSEGYSGTFSAHPFALYTSNIDRLTILPGGNIGIGTSTPYTPLSVWATTTRDRIAEFVNYASTTALSISGMGFGTTTVSGLNISGSATTTSNVGINLSAGCFAVNNTCLTNSTYGDASVNSYIHASTTIPKTYTANTFTALQTFNSGISLGSALTVANGGTGQTSFGQGWLSSDGTTITSSTSPTVAYITATSTTATSTFAGKVTIGPALGTPYVTGGVPFVVTGATSAFGGPGVMTLALPIKSSIYSDSMRFGIDNTTNASVGQSYIQSINDSSGATNYTNLLLNPLGGGIAINGSFADSGDVLAVAAGNPSSNAYFRIRNIDSSSAHPYAGIIFSDTPAVTASNSTYEKGGIFMNYIDPYSTGYARGKMQFALEKNASNVNVQDNLEASTILTLDYRNSGVGIGTTSPYANLSVQNNYGSTNTTLFSVASSTTSNSSTAGNLFSISNTGVFTASTTNSSAATSTINGNLYVNGTLRSTLSYVGDLFFANNFSFAEAPLDGTTQGLLLRNQRGQDALTIDENGNLSLVGDVCYKGKQCFGKTINELESNMNALASTTSNSLFSAQATTTASLSELTASLGNVNQTLINLGTRIDTLSSTTIQALDIKLSELIASTTFLNTVASSTADILASSTPSFIARVAVAVQEYIQSTGEWFVNKLTAKVAIFDRLETKTLCIGNTCITEDQLKDLLTKNNLTASSYIAIASSTTIVSATTSTLTPTPTLLSTPIIITATSTTIATTTITVQPINTASTTVSPQINTPPASEPIVTPPVITTPTVDTTPVVQPVVDTTPVIPAAPTETTPTPTPAPTTTPVPTP